MTRACKHPDGCSRPAKGHGWCKPHLQRLGRTGSVGSSSIAARQPGLTCSVQECGSLVAPKGAQGFCSKHYKRWLKHGDPTVVATGGFWREPEQSPAWTGANASYMAVHLRLASQRGSAKSFTCHCGSPAAHWAYDNCDPNEKVYHMGRYSTDLNRYSPMCVRCHSAHDRVLLGGKRPE